MVRVRTTEDIILKIRRSWSRVVRKTDNHGRTPGLLPSCIDTAANEKAFANRLSCRNQSKKSHGAQPGIAIPVYEVEFERFSIALKHVYFVRVIRKRLNVVQYIR